MRNIIASILIILTVAMIELLLVQPAQAADNSIYIDSIATNNTVTINQDGTGHVAGVAIGAYLPTVANDLKTGYGIGTSPYTGQGISEFNSVSITQQGPGIKTSTVEIPQGAYNNITTFQDGTGNHTTAIQNLQGNSNTISVYQDGTGNHAMNIVGGNGTTNSNNTINTTQTGAGDKTFNLNLNGTNGATVTVQQTNPTTTNTGSMAIQCTTCGSYSYVRQ